MKTHSVAGEKQHADSRGDEAHDTNHLQTVNK